MLHVSTGKLVALLLTTVMPVSSVDTSSNSSAQSDEPPSVEVTPVDWYGKGCNKTNTMAVVTDKRKVSLLYKAFTAKAPSSSDEAHSSCKVALRLKYPPGYTFGVLSTRYAVGVKVGETASAELISQYAFTGTDEFGLAERVWDAPVDKFDSFVHELDTPVYVPCGGTRDLYVSTRIAATAGSADQPAQIGVSAQHTEVKTDLNIDWKECP